MTDSTDYISSERRAALITEQDDKILRHKYWMRSNKMFVAGWLFVVSEIGFIGCGLPTTAKNKHTASLPQYGFVIDHLAYSRAALNYTYNILQFPAESDSSRKELTDKLIGLDVEKKENIGQYIAVLQKDSASLVDSAEYMIAQTKLDNQNKRILYSVLGCGGLGFLSFFGAFKYDKKSKKKILT